MSKNAENQKIEWSENEKLFNAAAAGDQNHVKNALKEGADINYKTEEVGLTPLMCACFRKGKKFSAITKFLLTIQDIDINATDNDGRTALILAASEGNLDQVRELLKKENLNLDVKSAVKFQGGIEGKYTAAGIAFALGYGKIALEIQQEKKSRESKKSPEQGVDETVRPGKGLR